MSRKKAGASFNCCFSEGNIGVGKTYSLKDTSMGVTSSSTDEGNGYSSKIISWAPISASRTNNSNDIAAKVVIKSPAAIADTRCRRIKEIDSASRRRYFLISDWVCGLTSTCPIANQRSDYRAGQ